MRTSAIRLTESELVTLVNRIVNENMMSNGEMEEGWLGDKMKSKFGWVMDAAKKVAELFKDEYMDDIPEEKINELKDQAANILPNKFDLEDNLDNMDSEEGEEALTEAAYMLPSSRRLLKEGLLLEGKALDKALRILDKIGITSGLAITTGGLLAFASQAMGFTDVKFLGDVHDIVKSFGCGIYCGPLSLIVMILGVAIAFFSWSKSIKRQNSRRGKNIEESRRRYERRKKELFYERKNPRRYRR